MENEISESCKDIVKELNQYIDLVNENQQNQKKEAEILIERTTIAENAVLQFKNNFQNELQKAYKTGYNDALNNSHNSDNVEGGTKLVISKN